MLGSTLINLWLLAKEELSSLWWSRGKLNSLCRKRSKFLLNLIIWIKRWKMSNLLQKYLKELKLLLCNMLSICRIDRTKDSCLKIFKINIVINSFKICIDSINNRLVIMVNSHRKIHLTSSTRIRYRLLLPHHRALNKTILIRIRDHRLLPHHKALNRTISTRIRDRRHHRAPSRTTSISSNSNLQTRWTSQINFNKIETTTFSLSCNPSTTNSIRTLDHLCKTTLTKPTRINSHRGL